MDALSPARRAQIHAVAEALLTRCGAEAIDFGTLLRVCKDEGIALFDADLRDIAGALRRESGHWRLYLNREDSAARRLFTLAHALGHYALHTDGGRTFVESRFTRARAADVHDTITEQEANVFAACLVMPAVVIDAVLADRRPTDHQVLALAERFGVSPLAMAHRLADLGYTVPTPQPHPLPPFHGVRTPAGTFSSSAWTSVR